jgi:hypothetical protein
MVERGGQSPRPIRVLLTGMPGLLASLIERSIADEKDMSVVDNVRLATDVGSSLASGQIDVIVTGTTGAAIPDVVRERFFSASPVPILAVNPDGTSVEVFGRRVAREVLLAELVAVIRDVARQSAE